MQGFFFAFTNKHLTNNKKNNFAFFNPILRILSTYFLFQNKKIAPSGFDAHCLTY